MINGVIPIGYKPGPGGCIEYIATDDGARILPEPYYVGEADGNGYRTLLFAITRENVLALRFCGLTAGDANYLLQSLETPGEIVGPQTTRAVVTAAPLD